MGKQHAARRRVGAVHALYDAKHRLGPGEAFEHLKAARWRLKNGLEHRALVALLHAPAAQEAARSTLTPADFLTPAYAALAAVVLGASAGSPELERARQAVAGLPWLPDPQGYAWEPEAGELVGRLVERRERWARNRKGGDDAAHG